MKLRNIILIAGAATVLGGCVITPHATPPRNYAPAPDYSYDDDYYDYHDTDSYEGYYYARIIFIGTIPYYVDDDRYIRPIPPRYHDHFRRYSYRQHNTRPPIFSRDREIRDGYPMSRIIYRDNVPYYVGDDRVARPMPNHLQQRFRYAPLPANGGRPQPPLMRDGGQRQAPSGFSNDRMRQETPIYDRERERQQQPVIGPVPMQQTPPVYERQEPPAYGRERERQEPPAYGRERERQEPPAYGRERERQEAPAYGRERERQEAPVYGREPERQAAPVYGREPERQAPAAIGRERGGQSAPANSSRGRGGDAAPAKKSGGSKSRSKSRDGENDDEGNNGNNGKQKR